MSEVCADVVWLFFYCRGSYTCALLLFNRNEREVQKSKTSSDSRIWKYETKKIPSIFQEPENIKLLVPPRGTRPPPLSIIPHRPLSFKALIEMEPPASLCLGGDSTFYGLKPVDGNAMLLRGQL